MGVAPPTPISLVEFAQFVTDMEGAFEKNGVDADLKPPASEDEIAHIINDDHAPLASLLAWHNGGIPIGEYELSSAHEIPPVEAADLVLPIGKNLDGGELFVQPSTGILFSADEGGTPVAQLLAQGQVALGFQQLSELIHAPGIAIVGPMPADIAIDTVFTGAVRQGSARLDDARALLAFMASLQADAAKRRQGMSPV
jgi:hypothetical protein